MKKLDELIFKTLCGICVVLMMAMMTVIFAQVVARYALGNSLSWSEEVGRYIFVWITFLGMVVAFKAGAHVALDIVLQKLCGKTRKMLRSVNCVLILVLAVGLFFSSLELMELGAMQESPALELPMNWVYSVIPVSGFLMIYFALRAVWTSLFDKSEDVEC